MNTGTAGASSILKKEHRGMSRILAAIGSLCFLLPFVTVKGCGDGKVTSYGGLDLMRQGVEEGTLRGGDPGMLASAYMGMVHNCIFEALASGAQRPSRSPGDVLGLFLDGASGGATPRHGAPA